MPFHGDVRDFGVVVIGAGLAGTTAAELDGVLEVMYPAVLVRDREVGEQFRQATLERIGERGLH